MIKAFTDGIGFVGQGFQLAKRPGIRPYMLVPFLMNFVLFSAFGYFTFDQLSSLVSMLDWVADFPGWLDWLEAIVNWLFGAFKWLILLAGVFLMLFIMGSVFTMLTHLLVSPFIGLLGEKVERELHTVDYPVNTLSQIALRTIKRELVKFRYWILRALGLGVVTIILWSLPIVNALTPVIWYLFGAWMLAMQYIDIPADNNGYSFEDVLALMRRHRAEIMGFGGAIMLLTATPIVNLFIIPIAVAGGVVFWVERFAKKNPVFSGTPSVTTAQSTEKTASNTPIQ